MIAIGVGVTHSYDKIELEGIASDPNDRNIFYTQNFTTLQDIAHDVVLDVCDGKVNFYYLLLTLLKC